MQKKIKITDVARLAGVSKGTVDRVIHNRGEVSKDSKRKVEEIIKKLGYEVDINASILALRKSYTVVCLVPKAKKGEYWDLITQDTEEVKKTADRFNITVITITYDLFSIESFQKACNELLEMQMNAVILAPMYVDVSMALVDELDKREIPYVYIDSKIDDTSYLAYYGMPMYESGYLGADLLINRCNKIDEIAVFRVYRGDLVDSNPTLFRRNGFNAYIKEHISECKIHTIFFKPYDREYNTKIFDDFFNNNPTVTHLITFNSRAHIISDYLKKSDIRDKVLIGYDMLDKNIEALKGGYVSVIITEKVTSQINHCIKAIIDYLIGHKRPKSRDNHMPMDILTKYNVDYYQ